MLRGGYLACCDSRVWRQVAIQVAAPQASQSVLAQWTTTTTDLKTYYEVHLRHLEPKCPKVEAKCPKVQSAAAARRQEDGGKGVKPTRPPTPLTGAN
jgi:hypothetical protein